MSQQQIQTSSISVLPERAGNVFKAEDVITFHLSANEIPEDSTIKIFWKVLEEFTNEQRSHFIEFAWGRSRLPRPGTWVKPLGLTRLGTDPGQLPIAHTCFYHYYK